ncbi:MAG: HAD domain-containing protein [Chitinophagales bacterium]
MEKTILILDLDGVLITTPPWKQDRIHADGYSDFNPKVVQNLNELLQFSDFEIWLSSARRTTKSLEEFNQIFKNRSIEGEIIDFLPIHKYRLSRREEIEYFLVEKAIENYLIIDDDKSLSGLEEKSKLVLTELLKGFDRDKLKEAKIKVSNSFGDC